MPAGVDVNAADKNDSTPIHIATARPDATLRPGGPSQPDATTLRPGGPSQPDATARPDATLRPGGPPQPESKARPDATSRPGGHSLA